MIQQGRWVTDYDKPWSPHQRHHCHLDELLPTERPEQPLLVSGKGPGGVGVPSPPEGPVDPAEVERMRAGCFCGLGGV